MNEKYEFEMAWSSIYHTFEDNAFDTRNAPVYNDSNDSVTVGGTTYYASPF
jgi:hypothetical protein